MPSSLANWFNCARMAACDPPGSTLPVSVTCRCRLMRLMDEGPVPGTMCTTSSSPTEPTFEEGTVILRQPFGAAAELLLRAHHARRTDLRRR